MKPITVVATDLQPLEDQIQKIASVTVNKLADFLASEVNHNALRVLAELRFSKTGTDPLISDSPLNLVEQLNQAFTVLTSIRAAKHMFATMKISRITMNLGPHKGTDLEAFNDQDQIIAVAEVFAAVKPSSNNKLRDDIERVRVCNTTSRSVYFISPIDYEFKVYGKRAINGELTLEDGVFIKHLRDPI